MLGVENGPDFAVRKHLASSRITRALLTQRHGTIDDSSRIGTVGLADHNRSSRQPKLLSKRAYVLRLSLLALSHNEDW